MINSYNISEELISKEQNIEVVMVSFDSIWLNCIEHKQSHFGIDFKIKICDLTLITCCATLTHKLAHREIFVNVKWEADRSVAKLFDRTQILAESR